MEEGASHLPLPGVAADLPGVVEDEFAVQGRKEEGGPGEPQEEPPPGGRARVGLAHERGSYHTRALTPAARRGYRSRPLLKNPPAGVVELADTHV